jgi:hypothetical protein
MVLDRILGIEGNGKIGYGSAIIQEKVLNHLTLIAKAQHKVLVVEGTVVLHDMPKYG